MRYEGMLCDGCGKLLDAQDDIVTCPVCGTPQHRDCWAKRGMCVHAALHEGGFRWQIPAQQASQEDIHCPVCRNVNPPDTLVCPHCGSTLFTQEVPPAGPRRTENPFLFRVKQNPNETIDGVRVEDMADFVQSRAYSYINTFQKLEKNKTRPAFHWAGMLFGHLWLFYRKLYAAGLLCLGLTFALSLISYSETTAFRADMEHLFTVAQQEDTTQAQLEDASNKMYASMYRLLPYTAVQLALDLTVALIANRLYKRKVLREVRSIRQHTRQNGDAFRSIALRKGGVSLIAVLGAWLLTQLLGSLVSQFLFQ